MPGIHSARGKKILFLIFIIALMLQTASAQSRWSLEIRPGLNHATKDFVDADLGTGYGLEGTVSYRFTAHMSVYAGWGWNKFQSTRSFAGPDAGFEETGYTYGLQFFYPIRRANIHLMVRGGATTNHIEVENNQGDIIADSGHGIGFQLEGGAAFLFGTRWRLMPSIRYRSLSRDLRVGNMRASAELNYVSAGVSVIRVF